jgi:alpha-tubulin suppressor-like RCC1 family protein
MVNFTFTSNGSPLEDSYVTWEELGLDVNEYKSGGLWAWGLNTSGELGLGNTTSISSPVQVGTLTNWNQVTCGDGFNLAVKSDGTLWSWGKAGTVGATAFGQLGLGDNTSRSSPVQIGTLTNWKQAATGATHSIAIKTDGTMWIWGKNVFGELGLNDRTHRSSPVQVGSLTNWKQADGGERHTAAVKTDGTLWTWGLNNIGQLGLNDLVHRSSPVQVGSLTNWNQIACGFDFNIAVKTDGTLWTWGSNSGGRLGDGTVTNRSSPVQIGSLTNWKQAASGSASGSSLAVKTDGTLWAWGVNGDGTLGLGDSTNKSSPVQVGTLTNWKQINASSHSLAVKTDGTLWAWGRNGNGQLGLGNTTSISSPVQVGTLTNWKQAAVGTAGSDNHSLAILLP